MFFTESFDINTDPEAGNLPEIWNTIITDAGFEAEYDTFTDFTTKKYISDNKTRLERAQTITTILGWIMFHDYQTDKIRLSNEGFEYQPTVLSNASDGNIFNNLIWEDDLVPVRNKLTVKGAFKEAFRKITFNGDGSTATFNFPETPTICDCVVDDVTQIQGVEGSSETYDYSFDPQAKTFTFQSGSIPGSGTNNIVMNYTTRVPANVEMTDYTSVEKWSPEDDYGNKVPIEDVYSFDDVVTTDDAKTRCEQLLNILKDPPTKTTIETSVATIRVGQIVTVKDVFQPERSGDYFVKEVNTKYPSFTDTIVLGDEDFNIADLFDTIQERMRALSIKEDSLSEILNIVIGLVDEVFVENRSLTVESATQISDVLYWDSTTQGTWDSFDWSDGTEETYTEDIIVCSDGTFREYLTDTDYYSELGQ